MKNEDDKGREDSEADEREEEDAADESDKPAPVEAKADAKPDDDDDDDDDAPKPAAKSVAKDDDEDDDDDSDPPPRAAERKPIKRELSRKSTDKPRPKKPARAPARVEPVAPESSAMSRGIMLAVLGLGLGVAGGWFLKDAHAKGRTPFKRGPAPISSEASGECKTWQDKICAESGDTSAGCAQARSAAGLMPYAACGAALEDVPGTLARIKQARAVCDDLVTKLCNDLGNETDTCKMVRTKTEQMATENCRSMTENYAAVIGQLKMMQEGGPMGGGRPPGGRPMPPPGQPVPPPGHPPDDPH